MGGNDEAMKAHMREYGGFKEPALDDYSGPPPPRAKEQFTFELSIYEAGYLAGLLAREGAEKAAPWLGQLSYRLGKAAYNAQREAIEAANARYLGRRDDG